MYSYNGLPSSRYKRPGPESQLKGTVSKVNLQLLYFEVDHAYRIYINTASPPLLLPHLQDTVEVLNLKAFSRSTYTGVMGPETVCRYSSSQDVSAEPCTQFLISSEVYSDIRELMAVDAVARKLERCVEDNGVYLALKALWDHSKKLQNLQVKVVTDVVFANENSSLYTFYDFKEVSCFNVYPSQDHLSAGLANEYLFGILSVTKMGQFLLKDNSKEIFVKFTAPSKNLQDFHGGFVLIKKFIVFTETYTDPTVPTLQYILVNSADVRLIKPGEQALIKPAFYGIKQEFHCKMAFEYYLQPHKISEAIAGYQGGPECWLEATVSDTANFQSSDKVYVIIPTELLQISAFLKEGVIYRVFCSSRWKVGDLTKYRELYGLKELKRVVTVDSDAVFQETDLPAVKASGADLRGFDEVKTAISQTACYSMISFTLPIARKSFQENSFASWFPKRFQSLPHFGNIGNLQERLAFFDENSRAYIDLYLSNRDNHVRPLGLIEGMLVKVKHVQINKRKYFRSTVFTSFELMGFKPQLTFSSATLLFSQRGAWKWRKSTPETMLSAFRQIPVHCTVHGTVLFRSILDLHLDTVCVSCGREMQHQCSRCESSEARVVIYMVIQVQDSCHSEFTMEINEVSFLLELLGINTDEGLDLFTKECLRLKSVKFNFIDLNLMADLAIDSALHKMINVIQMDINWKLYFLMEVVCLRQEYGRKVWRVLDYTILADLKNPF